MEQNRPEINPLMLIINKDVKVIQWSRDSLLNNGAGATDYP